MAAGPFQRLARMLADMLHRIARALEGDGEKGVEAATATLARRFPGAPDHWLRYIAARAPHLADAEIPKTNVSEPEIPVRPAVADTPRWWWPRFDVPRRARLDLPPAREPEREEPNVENAEQTAMRAKAPQILRRPVRPRLRVVSEAPPEAAPKSAPLWDWTARRRVLATLPSPNVSEPAKREPEPLHFADASSKPRANLKLAAPVERDKRAVELNPFAGPGPRDEATRAPMPVANNQKTSSRRAERPALIPPSGRAPAEHLALQPAASPRVPGAIWTRWTHPRKSNVTVWSERPSAALPELPHWQERPMPGPASAAWTMEDVQNHWPTLLSAESHEIDGAAVRLPNIERLRTEQDFNAWSG